MLFEPGDHRRRGLGAVIGISKAVVTSLNHKKLVGHASLLEGGCQDLAVSPNASKTQPLARALAMRVNV